MILAPQPIGGLAEQNFIQTLLVADLALEALFMDAMWVHVLLTEVTEKDSIWNRSAKYIYNHLFSTLGLDSDNIYNVDRQSHINFCFTFYKLFHICLIYVL